ncbi:cytochrome P450 [Rhizopogon vinicolor AM-OR11-026]|uniref:Cytochrome P450 n=1 Tax=Rhizopogon vinicolor AM-OR11-026 TaxID=1314800 RepID=A0A1B7MYV9_9AGAM|nr:cytochrome P450 [Rhizopogon vinicolor AM-OR11-026]
MPLIISLTTMNPVFVAAAFAALVIVYRVYHRYTRISLADVPGPEPASFIMGNIIELFKGQAGEADFQWQAQYGDVVRFKGPFGEDQLIISDPAALQYIFVKSGYRFPKQEDRRMLSYLVNGEGLLWADGDVHKRQRRVMLPGFGGPESKAFFPLFKGCAESMSNKWMDMINTSKDQSAVINVAAWLTRATLDAVGEAAFDAHFGSIDNNESALVRAYTNMMTDVFASLSDGQIFFQGVSKYIPLRILRYLGETGNGPRLLRMREAGSVISSVAKQMVEDKSEMLLQGEGSRDILSLLVKANMDADAKAKLTEEEMIAQMRTLLLAGHETTSTTLSWALLELAKNPEIQSRFRAEIREAEATIHKRGDAEFTIADFDDMPYTAAVIKVRDVVQTLFGYYDAALSLQEVLRFSPAAHHVHRYASQDDILPLSRPITARFGKVIHELPVPKGTRIVASIAAYNRSKDLWGEDAHVFNPERWLNGAAKEKKTTSLGVYSNLMTFGDGVRTCIGWRFALIEMRVFLTEMVGNFEFALTDQSERVRREACMVMIPTVEGEVQNGVQLALRVSVAPRTEKEY